MELKDRLIAGSAAEKAYLKARKGLTDNSLAVEEQIFLAALKSLEFQSVADYQDKVFKHGHWWRTLKFGRYKTVGQIPYGVVEAAETGKDIIAFTAFDHTAAVLPDSSKAAELVDVDYCQSTGVEIVSHGGIKTGCWVMEAGNVGVLLVLHRPCFARAMETELKEAMRTVLLVRYGVETYIDKNELNYIMTKQFIANTNGFKIWGDSYADLGNVSMVVGGLTLEFHADKVNKILQKNADDPAKQPHGLNDLLGYKVDTAECLQFIITQWFEQTHSVTKDEQWQQSLR